MSDEHTEEQPRKRMRLAGPDEAENLDVAMADAPKPAANAEHEKELRFGITAYINPDKPGFSGILKQRYTDFLVNEVLPSGHVLHLDSLDLPPSLNDGEAAGKKEASAGSTAPAQEAQQPKTQQEPVKDSAEAGKPTQEKENGAEEVESDVSTKDVQTLQSIFGEATTASILSLYSNVLRHPDRKRRDFTPVTSEVIPDKDQRTLAHQSIRRIFKSKLETSTTEESAGPEDHNKISITAVGARKQQPANNNRGQNGNKNQNAKGRHLWDELGGEYLHFTLYKENKDTMEAISFLCHELKIQPRSFQFAGTKDRRAVTVQRCSAYRVQAHRLQYIGRKLRNAKVGGFQHCKTGLELGDLHGNEFVITLRDCHFPGEEGLSTVAERAELARKIIQQSATEFKTKGFINYYGLQRFGTFSNSTSDVGKKILQGDLGGAVDLILAYEEDALLDHLPADAESTARIHSRDDRHRAEAIKAWKNGKLGTALDKLPRRFSAEKSIMSHLGRQRNEKDFQGAMMLIQRNLRLMYVHAYQSLVWNVVAGKRWNTFGSKVVEGDLVLVNEHKDKEGGVDADDDAEVDQDGEVIIRPAVDDRAGNADDFDRARPLSKKEAESAKYNIFDVVLPLPGFDVVYPGNEIGDFYKEYMGSEEGGGLDPYNMRRKQKDWSLSGGYRKLIARPGPGVEADVRVYRGPEEQLVETDLERMGMTMGGKEKNEAHADVGAGEEGEEGAVEEEEKIAVVLKFQLGSSTYATMALREVMKAGGLMPYKPEYGGK
ncbi:tRNA pseudouridine synthase D [Aulographum hederae CBS 113979]|uniref:tRNA pseudouridine synthase D n=1 Tax=Aulographum hederae CBS 113979 TaxID=1176131 RepID=A0A6G1H0X1_9PEZI|nr:tRNA pseudouridine synthase D [Aulographum hederae CBS 113979]